MTTTQASLLKNIGVWTVKTVGASVKAGIVTAVIVGTGLATIDYCLQYKADRTRASKAFGRRIPAETLARIEAGLREKP